MEQVITAELRQEAGKGPSRRLRMEDKIPGVLYGKEVETMKLTLSSREIQKLADAESTGLIKLKLAGGEERLVLLKEIQYDHFYKDVIHVDLHEVSLTEQVTVTVPLVLLGEDERVKDGGILQQLLREIDLQCLPTQIPDQLTADVSKLTIGDSLTLGELELEEGLELVTPPEEVIATIVIPSEEPSEDEEDEDAVLEPEVIGEEGEASEEEAQEDA